MTFALDTDVDIEDVDILTDVDGGVRSDTESSDSEVTRTHARNNSLAKLEGQGLGQDQAGPSMPSMPSTPKPGEETFKKNVSPAHAKVRRKPKNGPDAVIVLKEERVRFKNMVPSFQFRC